jgi:hypothetical protein
MFGAPHAGQKRSAAVSLASQLLHPTISRCIGGRELRL